MKALVTFETTVHDPVLTLAIHNDQHQPVIVSSSEHDNEHSGTYVAGDQAVFAFSFHNMLAPGRYEPSFTVSHRGSGLAVIDRYEGRFSFVVTGSVASGGMVEVPVQSEVTLHARRAAGSEVTA